MADTKERPTLCIKDACALAGVSRRTLYNWMDVNKVQFIRTAGGSRRVFADTLFRAGNVRPYVKTSLKDQP